MAELAANLIAEARAYSVPEMIAVLFAVLYLVLVIRQNIWCWYCAGISTALFACLFFDVRLYMEALLNVFYFLMAIYGWRQWQQGQDDDHDLPVVAWSHMTHGIAIAVILVLSLATGYLLATHSDAAFPYVDSLTSWGAVWATFLVARKVLENWWYWLFIDATMVCIFWAKDLQFTSMLYLLYLVMIPFGLLSWTRSWRAARA